MAASRLKNPRRYRRATLRTGRLEVFVAVALVTALLVALALVALPSPLSGVAAAAMVCAALLVVLADTRHEDEAGRTT